METKIFNYGFLKDKKWGNQEEPQARLNFVLDMLSDIKGGNAVVIASRQPGALGNKDQGQNWKLVLGRVRSRDQRAPKRTAHRKEEPQNNTHPDSQRAESRGSAEEEAEEGGRQQLPGLQGHGPQRQGAEALRKR